MASKKKLCKYGKGCYRRNPKHLAEFSHPEDEDNEISPPAKRKKTTVEDFFKPKKAKGDDSAGPSRSPSKSPEKPKKSVAEVVDPPEDEADPVEEDKAAEEIPDSPQDVKESIKQKFLVEMPQDFYDFWDFAKQINSKKPTDAFMSSLGIQLVGPYDVLAGTAHNRNSKGKAVCYHRHWRYYYDPPEFLTVIRGDDSTQFHMGYYRDDPSELPVFVASNEASSNCNIRPRGPNIFAAVGWMLDEKIKKEKSDKLKKLKEDLKAFAEGTGHQLESRSAAMKARDKKVVTKSFHAAGLVVPVDEHEIGYRELPETDADLKKILKKIHDASDETARNEAFDPLMEIIMLVQFANDECDYGEGMELGIDMFCSGYEVLHKSVLNMLPLAYQLLNRQAFADIITAHLKDRKHTANLSQL